MAGPCLKGKYVSFTALQPFSCPAAPLQPTHLALEPTVCLCTLCLVWWGQLPGFSEQATLAPPRRPWHQKFPQPITPTPWSSTTDFSSSPSSSRKPMHNTPQAAPHSPKLVLWVFLLYAYDPIQLYVYLWSLSLLENVWSKPKRPCLLGSIPSA